MNDPKPYEIIEITIAGRRYKITLGEYFSQETLEEIRGNFHNKEIEPIELFKAHLNKIQEISRLNARLQQLLNKIP